MEPLNIRLDLDKITCHRNGSKWGNAIPYLWTVFFKIDGGCVKLTREFRLTGNAEFKFSVGSHGNLGNKSISEVSSIKIPSSIGHWRTTLHPLEIPYFEAHFPGIVGVLVVLLAQGNVSGNGAEAGHKRLNSYVKQAINQSISHFDPKRVDIHNIEDSVKMFFEHRVLQFTDGIVGTVENAIRNAQNIFQNLWSFANRDELIGFRIWDFNNNDIIKSNNSVKLVYNWSTNRSDEWEISGKLRAL